MLVVDTAGAILCRASKCKAGVEAPTPRGFHTTSTDSTNELVLRLWVSWAFVTNRHPAGYTKHQRWASGVFCARFFTTGTVFSDVTAIMEELIITRRVSFSKENGTYIL